MIEVPANQIEVCSLLSWWCWQFQGSTSGLHQGWTQTSLYLQVTHFKSHFKSHLRVISRVISRVMFLSLFIFHGHSTQKAAFSWLTYFILWAYRGTGVSHSQHRKKTGRGFGTLFEDGVAEAVSSSSLLTVPYNGSNHCHALPIHHFTKVASNLCKIWRKKIYTAKHSEYCQRKNIFVKPETENINWTFEVKCIVAGEELTVCFWDTVSRGQGRPPRHLKALFHCAATGGTGNTGPMMKHQHTNLVTKSPAAQKM